MVQARTPRARGTIPAARSGDSPPPHDQPTGAGEVVQFPGAAQLPPGARSVASTGRKPLYAVTDPASPAYGLWFDDGRRCSPLPYLVDVLARRDGAGAQRGVFYLLAAIPDGPRHSITDKDLTSGVWIGKMSMPVPEDRSIKEAVVTVIRALADGHTVNEAEARWDGGRLFMPPAELLPAGYLETAGDEATARRNWVELAEISTRPRAEHLALNIGAAHGAPYVRPLSMVRPVSAAFVGIGEPRHGKSTNTNAAAAVYGSPIRVNPVISESPVAIGDQLASLGCLPFFRDEIHAAGWTPAQWKTFHMRTLNGAGRRRSDASGSGQYSSARDWWGYQFMSGNIDPRFGATDGVQARVIVMGDPHLPDGATSDRITALLGQSYGWPLRWFLADHPTPEVFQDAVQQAESDLAEAVTIPDGSGRTVARTLAVAVAGAGLFEQIIGVPGVRAAALRSATRVLGTLVCTLADQSVRFDDQLYEAVWSDVTDHPASWPTKGEYEEALTALGRKAPIVNGVRHTLPGGESVVSMFTKPFTELTHSLDLAKDQALSDLQARGILVTGRQMGYRNKISVRGLGKVNAYTFRVVDTDDDGGQAATLDGTPTPTPTDATPAPPPAPRPTPADDTPAECSKCGQPLLLRLPGKDVCERCRHNAATAAAAATVAAVKAAEARKATRTTPGATGWLVAGAKGQAAPAAAPTAVSEARTATDAATGTTGTGETTTAPQRPSQPRGAHPAAATRTAQRQTRLAADLARLDAGESVRVLNALETEFAPRRRGTDGQMHRPYFAPELPGVIYGAHVVTGYHWTRPYTGQVTVLDRSGAWVAAASSADVAHGALTHTGEVDFTGRPGYYQVRVYPWHETDTMPHPLGHPGRAETVWVPAPTVALLRDLAEAGRWPDASILDSYTGDPVRLNEWTRYVNALRGHAIDTYGRDSDQYAEVKVGVGQAMSLMLGTDDPGHGRTWRCLAQRPDWTHTWQSQAAATLWRWADDCRILAPDHGPVMLRNVDELLIPAPALEIVTTTKRSGGRRPMLIDPTGKQLGTFKVKDTETWGAEQ